MKQCHEIDFEVIGSGGQEYVEITLDPGETVIAEAGAMIYMDEGISYEARMGDGGGFMSSLFSVGKRMIAGESAFVTHFTNTAKQGRKVVAFSAPYPGSIVGLDLSEVGGKFICQRDAFLCGAYGTEIGIEFTKRIGAGFFSGEGLILQNLTGDDKVILNAGGTIHQRDLNGETLMVDTGCIVGFTPGVDYDFQMAGGLKTALFGGEGLFLAKLSGHGTVLLQNTPFSRTVDAIHQRLPSPRN